MTKSDTETQGESATRPERLPRSEAYCLKELARGPKRGYEISALALMSGPNFRQYGIHEWADRPLRNLRNKGYVVALEGSRKPFSVGGGAVHEITPAGLRRLQEDQA